MSDKEAIQKIIDLYVDLGNKITHESNKLKNKLEPDGLDSSDLEALADQFVVWIGSLDVMNYKLHEIMTSKTDSI